ncbi:MAG: hypothetical protein ABI906_04085 [Pseudomonadota bacterium]
MKYLLAAAAALCLTGGAAMAQASRPYDQGYGPDRGAYDQGYGPDQGAPPYGDEGPGDRGYPSYDRNANSGYGDQAPYSGDGQSYGAGDPSYGNGQAYGEDPANPGGNYQAYGGAQPYPVSPPSYAGYGGAYGYHRPFVGGHFAHRGPRVGFFRGWRRPAHRAGHFPVGRRHAFAGRGRHVDRR